jgi:serine phosphatase RsbU (regulator of sigma subunit)
MLGMTFIDNIVKMENITSPARILEMLRDLLLEAFAKSSGGSDVKDGMEMAVLVINPEKKKLKYAGAGIGLYLVTNDNIIEFKGDKDKIPSIGQSNNFTDQCIELNDADSLYVFSDGYPDQFGGPKNKKYGYPRLRALLERLHGTSMKEQYKKIELDFETWRGTEEQTDDVLLLGIKV